MSEQQSIQYKDEFGNDQFFYGSEATFHCLVRAAKIHGFTVEADTTDAHKADLMNIIKLHIMRGQG